MSTRGRMSGMDLLRAMGGDDNDTPKPAPVAMDVERVRLADAFAAYWRQYDFAPGDLIRRKGGIWIESQGSKSATGAYVVIETRPDAKPFDDPVEFGLYGLKFDLYVGFYDEDGDFIFKWSDSRRYEPLPEDAE